MWFFLSTCIRSKMGNNSENMPSDQSVQCIPKLLLEISQHFELTEFELSRVNFIFLQNRIC